ncbi:ZXDC-like protein [Mya arenaria]|uniref:ZXDC-like protein n=1 Tax=Mya arenaria TaxID=6604 RepID=A0ABY7EYU3_MYAAR|nr:ZXDC-like protein [Mya arenaria]
MSLERGPKENGCAHGQKHVHDSENTLTLNGQYLTTESLADCESSVADRLVNQDGVTKTDTDDNSICENLPFLPELGTDCLDSYENAVVENNAEWLKARCKNFGHLEFDITQQSAVEEGIEFPVIVQTDGLVSSSASQSSRPITTNTSQGAQYATPYLTLSGNNIAVADTSWQTVEPLPSSAVIDSRTGVIENDGVQKQQIISFGNSEINLGELDINSLKANSNITIQDGVITIIENSDQDTSELEDVSNQHLIDNSFNNASVLNGGQLCTVKPSMETVILDTNNVAPAQTVSESLALTTISIATDNISNSTKILVDTSQGRQLYHLNISDLKKLQNAGTPVSNSSSSDSTTNLPSCVPSYILLANPAKDKEDLKETTDLGQPTIIEASGSKSKTQTVYLCSVQDCGKMFKNLAKLNVHAMTHNGDRPFKCPEPGCEWSFTKNYKLKRHIESHIGNKEYECGECKKKFTTIYNLKTHLKTHDRPCTEECLVEGCGRRFQTRRELDKHMRTHEGIEKTYKLRQHQRTHTGEKPYTCTQPGCTWAFSTASKLTRHMTKHTNSRKWICNVCGKAFMRSEHLKGHMIIHTGIKPFTCPVEERIIEYHCPMEQCGLCFDNKAKLRAHILKHFPGTARPEDAASIDVIPLLHHGIGAKQTVVQPAAVDVKASKDGFMTLDAVEFMATTVDSTDGSVAVTHYTKPKKEPESKCDTTESRSKQGKTQKIFSKKEPGEKDRQGSARTDYNSNHNLVEKAKKRQRLLREKAGIDESSEPQAMDMSPTENGASSEDSERLRSHGITFRDPETGVLYVQMQLLQDDPPHPDLYSDDSSLTPQLDMPTIHDSHTSEFVGSTINLQDLVG